MGQVGVYPQTIQFPAVPIINRDYYRKAGVYHRFAMENRNTNNLSLTAQRVYLRPFIIPRKCLITEVAIRVITAVAGKNIYWGIYEDNNINPGKLYVQGSVSIALATVKTEAKTFVLNEGLYWTAIGANAASATLGIELQDELWLLGLRGVVDGSLAYTEPTYLTYDSPDISAGFPDTCPAVTAALASTQCPSFWMFLNKYL